MSVFITSISSDIGLELARIYLDQGMPVIGTYRNSAAVAALKDHPDVTLFPCDLMDDAQIAAVAEGMREKNLHWDICISAAGLLEPIGGFFDCDVKEWKNSVTLNSLQQLHMLHALYPYKTPDEKGYVGFLVGGAINRAFPNYSAYSLGKVMLVKFCELIATEYTDLHAVAVGTGWVATKIHAQTLAAGDRAGDNLQNTKSFIDSGQQGTTVEDIYKILHWCFARPETNGRNFSVVHDDWRAKDSKLPELLRADDNMYRLRRYGN